jgi:predicted transcriptional regulator
MIFKPYRRNYWVKQKSEGNVANSVDNQELITLTADIAASFVSNNRIGTGDIGDLIASVHSALSALGQSEEASATKQEPAVSIRSSVKPDHIVCLEDGKKLKMLKRYLMTKFEMTPEQYRAKWDLKPDYPMVAPNYSATRKALALTLGLGRKAKAGAATDKASAKPKGREPKAVTEAVAAPKAAKPSKVTRATKVTKAAAPAAPKAKRGAAKAAAPAKPAAKATRAKKAAAAAAAEAPAKTVGRRTLKVAAAAE